MKSSNVKNPGGRPAKFTEPSRPITVTLPERILNLLKTVNSDRAKAITAVVENQLGFTNEAKHPVVSLKVSPGTAIILTGHSDYLKRIPWLRLIEVSPARNLISIQSGTSIESMELALHDLIEEIPQTEKQEREILELLLRYIRTSRRSRKSIKEEILFIEADT